MSPRLWWGGGGANLSLWGFYSKQRAPICYNIPFTHSVRLLCIIKLHVVIFTRGGGGGGSVHVGGKMRVGGRGGKFVCGGR